MAKCAIKGRQLTVKRCDGFKVEHGASRLGS
jgi:hypothetical protein